MWYSIYFDNGEGEVNWITNDIVKLFSYLVKNNNYIKIQIEYKRTIGDYIRGRDCTDIYLEYIKEYDVV